MAGNPCCCCLLELVDMGVNYDELVRRLRELSTEVASIAVSLEPCLDDPSYREYPESLGAAKAAAEASRRDEQTCLQAADAIESLQRDAVPKGWALVPIEPTQTMEACGFESDEFSRLMEIWPGCQRWPYDCREAAQFVRDIYQSMVDAAPKPDEAMRESDSP